MLKAWLWLAAAFVVLVIGLLVGPRVPADRQVEFCVVNVKIAGPFGVSIICDSPEYLRLAREPSGLLEPNSLRQSRPGLVLAAAAIARVLAPLSDLAKRIGITASRSDIEQGRIDNALAKDFPGFVAYVTLNTLLMFATFYLFQLISAARASGTARAAIFVSVCMLFAAVDPMKPFFWSPHNQIFNILVPLLAFWASMRAADGALADWRFAAIVGAMVGAGTIAYPLFLIVVPCLILASLYRLWRAWSPSLFRKSALNTALLLVLAVAPSALWYLFVRAKTGGFYQHDMQHARQVLWIADMWHEGLRAILVQWIDNFIALFAEIGVPMLPAVALLAVLGWIVVANREATRPFVHELVRLAVLAAMVILITAAFYATVGLINWRVGFALVPPLIAAAGAAVYMVSAELEARQRRQVALACVLIAIAQSVAIVVKNGPYS